MTPQPKSAKLHACTLGWYEMERRLTAIVAADVVGYSRLMGLDEAGTHFALKAHRSELIEAAIARHGGRIVKLTGDGLLAAFGSVVSAVECSVTIQRGMLERNEGTPPDRRIQFRIGINLGDVIVDDDDILGDGVNVAARLESIAPPGGIFISTFVRDQIGERLDLAFEDMGERALKNIARPVRVFQVAWEGDRPKPCGELATAALPIPSKPSIAVLPFQNMSGDAEQDYFAEGLVEDLITNLSKNPGLFVIARNSSFAYKDKAEDIRAVAAALGVRYILEGSVRRAANRLRITGQLVDGASAVHIWAQKFEGAVEDIFDLQDGLTENIVGAIEPSLRRAEIERARRKPTDQLDAYDLFLRSMPYTHANTLADTNEALRLLEGALRLDPNYAVAHAYAAWCHEQRFFRGGFASEDEQAALRHAATALGIGTEDPQALAIGAFVHSNLTHEYETALAALDRALEMNGSSALAYGMSALVSAHGERHERAIDHARKALRLSPFDTLNYHPYCALTIAALLTERYEDAVRDSTLAIQSNPGFLVSYAYLAIAHARLSQLDAANAAVRRLRDLVPGYTISEFVGTGLWRRPTMEIFAASLREAGLAE